MVSRNNAVFKFVLDIKDFVFKGRRVVQVTNEITGSTTKASGSMDRLSTSAQRTGQSMAANAVNFQTATQGMLNLSTAGVQTFTSFSNLDRAGNRLAMAQIGVSRATDLLNNKQLRLNELQERGLGSSQKAALLTNELKTARADLLVKTDKLKIEEGALFDIQLLFVTNIANVMISSLQTIVSLKNAHIFATIKQIVQDRLLATTTFSRVIPALHAQTGALANVNVGMIKVINTQRLMAIGIPVIGGLILGASVAVQAYTENWGGFRDMVQSVLPFMRDQKQLLGEVQEELGGVNTEASKLNGTFEEQLGLVFRLPDSYLATARGLEKMENAYKKASEKAKEFNIEVSQNPTLFRDATQQGGFQPTTGNTSNVVKHEGDTRYTASAISAPGFQLAFAGGLYNRPIYQNEEFMNQAGNYVNVDTKGNKIVSQFPMITGQDRLTEFAQVISKGAGRIIGSYGALANEVSKNIMFSSLSGSLSVFKKDINESFARFEGFTSFEQKKSIEQQRQELEAIYESKGGKFKSKIPIVNPYALTAGRGKFTGGYGGFFAESGAFTFTGTDATIKGLREEIVKNTIKLQTLRDNPSLDPYGLQKKKLINENFNIQGRIDDIETDPERMKQFLHQDILLKETITGFAFTGEGDTAEEVFKGQTAFFKKKRAEDQRLQKKLIYEEIERERKEGIRKEIREGAAAAGISEALYAKRTGLGILLKLIPKDPTLTPPGLISDLTQMGIGRVSRGEQRVFQAEKVTQAENIRKRLEAGISTGLPMDTVFDRLVKRSFGRVGGMSLASDDPLLADTSGFGANRLAVFNQRILGPGGADIGAGTDIGAVADSIGLQDAMRYGEIQRGLTGFNYRPGQFRLRRTGDTVSEIIAARAEREALIRAAAAGGRAGDLARFIAQSGGATGSLAEYAGQLSDPILQIALGSGQISATDIYQNVTVSTPAHIKARIAAEQAFRDSPEGIKQKLLHDMNMLVSGEQIVRTNMGLDRSQGIDAARLGIKVSAQEIFLARTGFEKAPTNLVTSIAELLDIAGFNTRAQSSFIGISPSKHGWDDAARRLAGKNKEVNSNLINLSNRLTSGNYGLFPTIALQGVVSDTESVLSDKLAAETIIFEQQIDPKLKIGFQAFAKVMGDAKRGMNEIDDRIRYNERLSIISSGDSSI